MAEDNTAHTTRKRRVAAAQKRLDSLLGEGVARVVAVPMPGPDRPGDTMVAMPMDRLEDVLATLIAVRERVGEDATG